MWKHQTLPRLRAAIYEPSPPVRMLILEQFSHMNLLSIHQIQGEDDPVLSNPALSVDILMMEHSILSQGHKRAMHVLKSYRATHGGHASIVFTTNDPREANIRKAIQCGCEGIILRPFSPRSFCERVTWAIARKPLGEHTFVVAA